MQTRRFSHHRHRLQTYVESRVDSEKKVIVLNKQIRSGTETTEKKLIEYQIN